MINWNQIGVEQERRKDQLRDVQQQRLVVAARAARPRIQRQYFYHGALVRLGDHLVAWGWRLRIRYGTPEPLLAIQTDGRVDC